MDRVLRVVVIDDSAYVRKVVREILSRSPFLEVVGTARDGREALDLVEQLDPDVVTCDLIMPELDGVGFVREQMQRRPVPIIIMSVAKETAEAALTALDAGAVDFVQKPTALASEKIFEVSNELIEKVKAAGSIALNRLPNVPAPKIAATVEPAVAGNHSVDMVVLGISTGGPQALKRLIPQLPSDFPQAHPTACGVLTREPLRIYLAESPWVLRDFVPQRSRCCRPPPCRARQGIPVAS